MAIDTGKPVQVIQAVWIHMVHAFRVPARARGLEETIVQTLIDAHTEERQFKLLGERRVNVLQLNLALDALRR